MRGHEQHSGKADTPEEARWRAAPPSAQTAARVAATGAGAGLSAGMVMALQRTAGNAAVTRTLRQRHDRGASSDRLDPTSDHTQGAAAVQRSSVRRVLRSTGRPLDEPVRQEMESRLGADLSDVRLHTDTVARASAAEIGARAYTSGNHIVLGEGGADRHTLAHELTHVIQQRRGPVAGTDNGSGMKISDPSDRFEREAEANATRILREPVPAPAAAGAPSTPGTASTSAWSGAAVQRVRNKTDWADKILTEQKRNINKPDDWGDAAMHHKISKERLQEIAHYLDAALQKKNKAAKAFHATCLDAVDRAIRKKSHPTDKLLWNMAVNISIGPPSPVGDPGMQFDADTEEGDPNAPGERRMDEVSRHLKEVENLWLAARTNEDGIDDAWDGMNKSMRAAIRAHEEVAAAGTLAPPKVEQWMSETVEGHTSHHRKGLRTFPGEQRGMEMFTNWVNDHGIEGLKGNSDVAASDSFTKKVGERRVTLTMTVTEGVIYHICRRHTFKHFDFDDVKAVNNFWPAGTNVEQVREIVKGTLRDVVKECFEYYIEKSNIGSEIGSDETGIYEPVDDVKLKNIPAGGQTVFVIGVIEDVEETNEGDVGGVPEEAEVEANEPEPSRAQGKSKKSASKLKRLTSKFTKKSAREKGKGRAVETSAQNQSNLHYTGTIGTLAPDGKSSQTFLSTELQRIREAVLAAANTGGDQ